MISELTDDFIACYRRLPRRIQRQAKKNYLLWKSNSAHPSLEFKLVGKRSPTYSIRVTIGWRALGLKQDDSILWFWIGSHAEYDKLLKKT